MVLGSIFSPGSLQFCQPLSSSFRLVHIRYEVVAQVKTRAAHHGSNFQTTMRKDSGSGRAAGVVEDGVGSVEGGAHTLLLPVVVHPQSKRIHKKTSIDRKVHLAY